MDISKKGVAAMICLAINVCYAGERPDASWQDNMLFKPGSEQLRIEKAGRVMIYDGMTDKTVDRALDEQFDRMSSMMFIRTVVTDDDGEPVKHEKTGEFIVEDDDC